MFCSGELDVSVKGKLHNHGHSQLLSTLTKKQEKHLFYDRVSKKEAKLQIYHLSESSDSSHSESESENEQEHVLGYHRLLATLKNVFEEKEEKEEEEDGSVIDDAEMNDEDGSEDVNVEETAESAELQEHMSLADSSKRKDGEEPPGASQILRGVHRCEAHVTVQPGNQFSRRG